MKFNVLSNIYYKKTMRKLLIIIGLLFATFSCKNYIKTVYVPKYENGEIIKYDTIKVRVNPKIQPKFR
jgi:hypothetical protein